MAKNLGSPVEEKPYWVILKGIFALRCYLYSFPVSLENKKPLGFDVK